MTTVPAVSERHDDRHDDLVRRRDEALETSAWGEPFHLFQPRNLCFWVYLSLVAVGAFRMFSMFRPTFGFYEQALTTAALLVVVVTLAFAWMLRRQDRYERQPLTLLLAGFAWGGLAATFAFAIPGNTALAGLYAKVFGQVWASNWNAGLSAPLIEETSKAAGFVLLLGLARRLLRTVNDGLIVGAFIGLGFQAFEDFLYDINGAQSSFGTHQVSNVTSEIVSRTISDVVSHPLFTALFCAGLTYLIGTAAQPRNIPRGVGLVLASVLSHGVWDSATALGGRSAAPFVLLATAVVSLLILWLAFRAASGPERGFARDVLGPEVASGVLTAEELDALTVQGKRRPFVKQAGKRKARRKRKHILRAALDLCHDLATSKGADTPEVAQARRDLGRLRAAVDPEARSTQA